MIDLVNPSNKIKESPAIIESISAASSIVADSVEPSYQFMLEIRNSMWNNRWKILKTIGMIIGMIIAAFLLYIIKEESDKQILRQEHYNSVQRSLIRPYNYFS